MKKFLLVIAILFPLLQGIGFSQVTKTGTSSAKFLSVGIGARANAMGGAFGALGGDMTTFSINPAGIGVYRKSEFTFTPTFYLGKTSSKFMDNTSIDHKYNFNFNNLAIVGVSNTGNKDGWISVNFGFAYNKVNNFNNRTFIEGQNNNSSITDYFANLAKSIFTTTQPINHSTNQPYLNLSEIWCLL